MNVKRTLSAPANSRILGHYRLETVLGEGGMGVVYEAYDTQLERYVAVKLVREPLLAEPEARDQLIAEARSASALNHPNICTVHEIGQSNGETYIVMERVEGQPLSSLISTGGLSPEQVVSYGGQIADALAHAHAHGIVHRDLKSANVMITPEGRVKVLDFGLATRIRERQLQEAGTSRKSVDEIGAIAGTLHYVSPEVLYGKPADQRSDTWAFGVLLYEMATGQLPFSGATTFELCSAIMREQPARSAQIIPGRLWSVIERCLAKAPTKRYENITAARVELLGIGRRAGLLPSAVGDSVTSPRFLLAVLFCLLVVGLYFLQRSHFWEKSRLSSPSATLATTKHYPVVAVPAFHNLSGRASDEWVGTALAGMLCSELASSGKVQTLSADRLVISGLVGGESTLATAEILRKSAQAQTVVGGSYAIVGGRIRFDGQVIDVASGNVVANIAESTSEAKLFDLATSLGAQLRSALKLGEADAEQKGYAQAALPASLDATRLYAEGLIRLRRYDATGARPWLERALTLDPNYALAHSALGEVWARLGYDQRASEEVQRAAELAIHFADEDRLIIEGRQAEIAHNWPRAIQTYGKLHDAFPENLDYGLKLASAQSASGNAQAALQTLAVLRKLPGAAGDDPRIDLAMAEIYTATSDFKAVLFATQRAADSARNRGMKIVFASANMYQGHAYFSLGDPVKAQTTLEAAKRAYQEAGDTVSVARTTMNEANLLYAKGESSSALETYQKALSKYLEAGNRSGVAVVDANIGAVLGDLGQFVRARNYLDQSLATYREIQDKVGAANAMGNIAANLYQQGLLSKAGDMFNQCLQVYRQMGDRSNQATALLNLGNISLARGNLSSSLNYFQQALTIYREVGDESSTALALKNLSEVMRLQDNSVGATARAQEALAIQSRLGEQGGKADTLRTLAALYGDQERWPEAENAARQSAEEFAKENRADEEVRSTNVLIEILLKEGKASEADQKLQHIVQLLKGNSNRDMQLSLLITQARLEDSKKQHAKALRMLGGVIAAAKAAQLPAPELEARQLQADIEQRIGSPAANSHLASLERIARSRGFSSFANWAAAQRSHGREQN
jgi:eukaryotic-like serine/threonine-protein kinase